MLRIRGSTIQRESIWEHNEESKVKKVNLKEEQAKSKVGMWQTCDLNFSDNRFVYLKLDEQTLLA